MTTTSLAPGRPPKPYRGVGMEGAIAHWYAKTTSKTNEFRRDAERLAATLRVGAEVLEVAPGPGYLALELCRLGHPVTGLDVSRTFVEIASANAARAGACARFLQGDAAHMPFADAAFDFCVCRAAFKNFSDPEGAIAEMHRVLRPGGAAVIIDLRADASNRAIDDEVAGMGLGVAARTLTRLTLRALRSRAYSQAEFQRMAAASPFGRASVAATPLGFEIRLQRLA